MAAAKTPKPWAPIPPTKPKSDGGAPQSYGERVQKGRKELALWLDEEKAKKLTELQTRLDLKTTKEVVERAIDELHSKLFGSAF